MLHKVNFGFFQVLNKLSAITCRASWQVQVEDIDLGKKLISSKRLHMDDSLSKILMEFTFTLMEFTFTLMEFTFTLMEFTFTLMEFTSICSIS